MKETLSPPLADSPWFWLYTFATFGLVLLVLVGPKFEARRAQQERQFQGRTRALQERLGEEPSMPLSEPGRTWLTLQPLYVLLAVMIVLGWSTLWWQRRRPRTVHAEQSRDESKESTA